MITQAPADGSERIWGVPLGDRLTWLFCLALLTALPGGLLAVLLVTSQVEAGGWIALALAVLAWAFLAWRAVTLSVTLTPDTLVIRNILATERQPLALLTEVGFRRGQLTVTVGPGTQSSSP